MSRVSSRQIRNEHEHMSQLQQQLRHLLGVPAELFELCCWRIPLACELFLRVHLQSIVVHLRHPVSPVSDELLDLQLGDSVSGLSGGLHSERLEPLRVSVSGRPVQGDRSGKLLGLQLELQKLQADCDDLH